MAVVGQFDRLFLVARAHHRDDRTEAFIAIEVHLRGDAGDDRRWHQHAVTLSACGHAGALGHGVVDQAVYMIHSLAVDHGA